MIEATSESLRPNFRQYNEYSGKNTDMTVIMMSPGGTLTGAYNMNYWDASISIGIGGHSFFIKDGDYIFGSSSFGYKTKYQNVTYSITAPTLDTSVFKWNPTSGADCFYTATMDAERVQNAIYQDKTPGNFDSSRGYTNL